MDLKENVFTYVVRLRRFFSLLKELLCYGFFFVETVGAFGFQRADLNISLTAIGLLWNMADFLHRDRVSIANIWDDEQSKTHSDSNNDEVAANITATASLGNYWFIHDGSCYSI